MTWLMALILGAVQGVAEFLPISSSGHLTLVQHFFPGSGLQEPDNLFNILLHFATLIAVVIVYWRDVVDMILEFFRGIAALFGVRSESEGTARHVPPPGVWSCSSYWGRSRSFWCCPLRTRSRAWAATPPLSPVP